MTSITSFDGSVPANYDEYLGPILFEPYSLDLTERLKKEKVENLLELACGTGRVTKHLVDLIPTNGRLVATDINPGMLTIAQSKVKSGWLEWQIVNAQELPFDDGQFDHVVCQFGVMFFPDKEKSFREVNRVLKAKGKYIFNVWESIENNPRINTMWRVINKTFSNEAPDFFQKGPHSFHDKGVIERLLSIAGFKNIRIETVAKKPNFNKVDDLVKGFTEGSPLSSFLKEKDEKAQLQFKQNLKEAFDQEEKVLGNTVPSVALVIEATK